MITLNFVKQKFDEFNEQMFDGRLATPPFKLSSARSFLGQVRYRRKKEADGTWHYYDFEFVVSTKAEVAPSEFEDTVLHEMIHYYILSNQMQDTGPHGKIFVRMMKDINMKFNRNISVAHKSSEAELDNDKEKRRHLVCVTRFRTNQLGITIATKSRLLELWDELPKIPKVAECTWYVSTDPFYNRFPRSSTAKIYAISHQELEAHNTDFCRLVRDGNIVRVEKN